MARSPGDHQAGEYDANRSDCQIVARLADYSQNKAHNRHIHIQDCVDLGLKIERLEDDQELQDLVLTVHHCFMHVENHLGIAQVKQMHVVAQPPVPNQP